MAEEMTVIGAGPAGAAAAAAMARAGLKVTVYEAHSRLALKPCGRAVPATDEMPLRVPRSSIVQEIRRVTLYVDGVKTVDVGLREAGYIVDKEDMLEDWIVSSGADLVTSSPYNPLTGTVRLGGEVKEVTRGVLSGGAAFYGGERIMAIQSVVRPAQPVSSDEIIIFFDTGLLGYYWVFPAGDYVEVGVGGFADATTLLQLLNRFISERPELAGSRVLETAGAPIAVGGVEVGVHRGLVKAGESAGFVLPLTGEGIRPSALSGFEAGRAIAEGLDPSSRLQGLRIAKAIRLQRSILQAVKGMRPERRREFLISIPPQVHEEVALGSFNLARIAAALIGRPDILASLMKYIGGGLGA